MLRLDATTRKLQAVLAGAITTNQLPCMVSYSDKTSTNYSGATQLANTNNTTQVDICDAPAASTVRDIDYLSIRNRDTASATVTVLLDDASTDYEIVKATLAVGDQLVYTHGNGWQVIASDGATKTIGNTGATGNTGAQGPVGLPVFLISEDGEEGNIGPQGIAGTAGTNGSNGATGSQGPVGPAVFLVAEDGEEGMMGPPGAGTSCAAVSGITLGTPVASTSGTSIDFTSIPSGTKRITINFAGVSTNSTSNMLVQLGDAGGIENTGYISGATNDNGTRVTSTAGFVIQSATTSGDVMAGRVVLELLNASTFKWTSAGQMCETGSGLDGESAGSKSLSAELDRVRITTVGGTATFDAGEINITYE